MAVLQAQGIDAGYGQLQVLWQAALSVEEGMCVLLLGPNGAGKTTLLKSIVGLIPIRAGSVELLGDRVESWSADRRIRRGMGYMSERGAIPALTVEENLWIGGYGLSRQKRKEQMRSMYGQFPALAGKRRASAGSLSGGQRKMLGLAKAMMGHPKVLLLDEPSAGLSPLFVREVIEVLGRIRGQGYSLLISEQNVKFMELADRVAVLDGGRIRYEGTVQQARENADVAASYFGLQP